jgi:hypothetical protein
MSFLLSVFRRIVLVIALSSVLTTLVFSAPSDGGRLSKAHRPPVLPAAGDDESSGSHGSNSPGYEMSPNRVAFNPANGDTFAMTNYDYGWNGPSKRNVVSYAPSPALPGTHAHISVMRRPLGGSRCEYYTYFDGSTYNSACVIPTSTRATGFGGIDVFSSGDADGITVSTSHTPTAVALNLSPGDLEFFPNTLPNQSTAQLDPKVAVDNANQIIYCITTGRNRNNDYWMWKSEDYGISWVFVDSLAKWVSSLPAGDRMIAVLDPDFQVTSNGDIYVFLTARQASATADFYGLPPLGDGTLSTVNRFGYLKSTNRGVSWTWTTAYYEGARLNYVDGDTLDYGVPLSNGFAPNNSFGHASGCVDASGVVHLIMNGCALHFIDSVTYNYVFGIQYWNSQRNSWTQISRPSDTHNPLNDTQVNKQWCGGYVGQPKGRNHPSIAYYPGSQDLFVAWSEATINGATEDLINDHWVHQVWYNRSTDGGNTWTGATQLTPNSFRSGKYFTSVGRQLTLAGSSTSTLRAHIAYISDPDNRNLVAPDPGAIDMLKPYIYQTVDFPMTSTGVVDGSPLPREFGLSQNYPNPFNPSTRFSYNLPEQLHVTLSVYNTLGQRVATVLDGMQSSGHHEVVFNADKLSSGVYFYELRAGLGVERRKMILAK